MSISFCPMGDSKIMTMTGTVAESDPLATDEEQQFMTTDGDDVDTFIKEELMDFDEETPSFIPGFGISGIMEENPIVVRKMNLRDRMKPPPQNKKGKITTSRSRTSPRYCHCHITVLKSSIWNTMKF